VISLKLKLVLYFLVLSLLPLAGAYWSFSSVARDTESRRVDERLRAGLRAALAVHGEDLERARDQATRLARGSVLQTALLRRDRAEIERLLGGLPVRVRAEGLSAGSSRQPADEVRITVRTGSAVLGRVIAFVPLDRAGLDRLARRSGLLAPDRLVLVRPVSLGAFPGAPATVRLDGQKARALAAQPLRSARGVSLAIVSSQSEIDEAHAAVGRELLLGVLGSLLLIGLAAYGEGAAIVRTLRRFMRGARAIAEGRLEERVPITSRDEFGQLGRAFNDMADQLQAERRRLREVTLRFGQALTATHDVDQLLRIVVETAVEATDALGGTITCETKEIVRSGEPARGSERLELPLAVAGENFGTLVLSAERFSSEDHERAVSLVAQAVVALENARLHQIVEHQALVDGLTGLPNRRQCEQALATEVARAERFGWSLAFVLADLDGFKAINDAHGHPAGDHVLREFGDYLRESLREGDVAARWGGEEFAILLPGTDLEGAALLVERIRALLEFREIVVPGGATIPVTASFGVAVYPDTEGGSALVAAADAALYQAKRAGKNRVVTARVGVHEGEVEVV